MSERWVTFDELVKSRAIALGDGYRTKKTEHGKPGIPILRVAEVQDGAIRPEFVDYVSETYRSAMGYKVSKPGDIVLTTKGTVGRVAIVSTSSPEFVYSPQVCFFRVFGESEINRRYLYYWFKSDGFWRQATSRKSQTDMADYLNLADIRSMVIYLPNIKTQHAIATTLGALDDKIEINERIAATSLDLAESHYQQAVSVSSCRPVRLCAAARWFSGGTPKTSESSYWGGELPWISASSLKSPWIDDSDRKLTDSGARAGTRVVPAESVIFVVRGSSLKTEFRVGITQREVAFGQDCKALVALDPIDPHILFHAIRSMTSEIMEMVDETSIGAGRLSTDLISKLEIQVSRDTGEKLADELRSLDNLASMRHQESRILASLRDTLLPQLMSGKLRIRCAERIVQDAL